MKYISVAQYISAARVDKLKSSKQFLRKQDLMPKTEQNAKQ